MRTGGYRWVIVGAGAVLGCVAIGALFSLPVFIVPMAQASGWSRTGIATAMTIGFLAMAVSSMTWGALVDRHGPRPVVVAGSLLLACGLALASRASSLLEFELLFGLLGGAGAGAIFAPMMATVTGWFDTHRSLAVSLVSVGMGIAPLTMAPLAAWLVSWLDWRSAMLAIACLAAAVMLPTTLFVRRPPPRAISAAAIARGDPDGSAMTVGEALRSPQFAVLALTNFCCCATHSGPIFHTVSYAIACGIPAVTAVTIYSLEGLSGMGGRLVFGVLGDRLGAKRVLVAGLLVQAVVALAYFFVRGLDGFYVVAALFGFTYAGVMPLYSVIIRENFPLRMLGTIIGGTSMAGSLGMATGPVLGGWIYDNYATYSWLYVASFGMGIGATLVALSFRPFPRFIGAASLAPQIPR